MRSIAMKSDDTEPQDHLRRLAREAEGIAAAKACGINRTMFSGFVKRMEEAEDGSA